jgi:16S rRNA C1402 N4-methylase RsmH
VNTVSEEELVRIINGLGEERRARRIARAIVRARPFVSTIHLAQALGKAMNLPASVARAVEASISGTPDPERNSTFRRDERPI